MPPGDLFDRAPRQGPGAARPRQRAHPLRLVVFGETPSDSLTVSRWIEENGDRTNSVEAQRVLNKGLAAERRRTRNDTSSMNSSRGGSCVARDPGEAMRKDPLAPGITRAGVRHVRAEARDMDTLGEVIAMHVRVGVLVDIPLRGSTIRSQADDKPRKTTSPSSTTSRTGRSQQGVGLDLAMKKDLAASRGPESWSSTGAGGSKGISRASPRGSTGSPATSSTSPSSASSP